MLSLVGSVSEVAAFATTTPVHRMETEDMVCAAVKFANGALGVIDATTAAYPGFPERIEVIGEKATAIVAGPQLTVYNKATGDVLEIKTEDAAGGTGADPMAFPHDYHRGLIADFLDAVDHKREPAVSGAEALKVHRLIDALIESGSTGRPVQI